MEDDGFRDRLTELLNKARLAYSRAKTRYEDTKASYEEAYAQVEAINSVIALHDGQQQKANSPSDSAVEIYEIVQGANSVGIHSAQVVAELKSRGTVRSVTSVGMHLSRLKSQGLVEKHGRNWRVPPSQNKEPASAEAPAGPESRSAPNGAGHIEDPVESIL
ncbi:MAG: hypothetical protein OXH09_07110 [Gammaproteobacteria bacterium]|nr:hypothetical protein [Gammaproteobacteria bacterium]